MHTIVALAAALSFSHHGAFTLPQAHTVAVSYDASVGLNGHVQRCAWRDRHDAVCAATGLWISFDGGQAVPYHWKLRVTRSGSCRTHVIKRRSPTSGISSGRKFGNCFIGPLVALPVADSLQETDLGAGNT